MKKLTVTILTALALGNSIGILAVQGKTEYYQGQSKGIHGDIKIAASFEEEKISSLKILEHSETPAVGGEALKKLSASTVGKEISEIDTVAGATVTSKGFKLALEDALNNKNKNL